MNCFIHKLWPGGETKLVDELQADSLKDGLIAYLEFDKVHNGTMDVFVDTNKHKGISKDSTTVAICNKGPREGEICYICKDYQFAERV